MMAEITIAVLVLAAVILPFVLKRLWWWVGIFGAVIGIEVAATLTTGRTLSQQFWAAMELDPTWGWVTVGILLVGSVVLAVHMVWKQLNRREP